ncbi:MAG: replicative DNA helicase [Acidobacteriota bacterium]
MAQEKSFPNSPDAERSVLGAIMLDNRAINVAQEILQSPDFFLESHRKIFRVMEDLSERRVAIDILTVKEALEYSGELEAVGGAAYVSSLVDGVPKSTNVEHYAKIVKEKSILRNLIESATEIINSCYESDSPPEELLDLAEASIFRIASERLRTNFIPIRDIAKESLTILEQIAEHKELLRGIPSGFEKFDELTLGLQNGDLIIIAARPSMGKTTFCLNIAQHIGTKTNHRVGIFSLEMSREQLFLRMLCSEARIDSHRLRTGVLSKPETTKLNMAFNTVSEANIFVDDTPGIGIIEMRAKARRLKARFGLDLLIVDYLQLMRGRGKYESRYQEITDISRSLKELAKELRIPIIAVSQLSRAPEQRGKDRRPQLSDLRESGAIEQDADLVAFIYRDEVYNLDDPENKGKAEIIIAKQRNGPTGTVNLVFIKEYTKFENLETVRYGVS